MRKVVYFIRHGQSEHNAAFERAALTGEEALRAYATGFHDARLSPAGAGEARALRATVAALEPQPQAVLVSPLSRTLETAQLAFAGSPVPLVAVEEWRERHGRWPCERRRGVGELRVQFPGVDLSGLATEDELWADAREGRAAAAARARTAVARLLAQEGGALAVVSHSGFMSGSVFAGGAPALRVEGWPRSGFANCELRAVEVTHRDGKCLAARLLWRRLHQAPGAEGAAANAEASMGALYDIMATPEGTALLDELRPQMRTLWLPLKPLPLTSGAVALDGALSVERAETTRGLEVRPWRIPTEGEDLSAPGSALTRLSVAARIASGVRLTFCGSLRRVRLVALLPDAHHGASYDLVVNNSIVATRLLPPKVRPHVREDESITPCPEPPMPHEVIFEGLSTCAGDSVELWLPHASAVSLLALEVDRGAAIGRRLDARPRWLVHGTSALQGDGARSPASTWPAMAARIADVRLLCLGFGGCLLEPAVARIARDQPADAITLELGVDADGAPLPAPSLASRVLAFVRTLREGHPRTPLVVVSPWGRSPLLEEARRELGAALELLRQGGDAQLFCRDGRELLRSGGGAGGEGRPSAEVHELMARRFAALELGPEGHLLPGRARVSARL